MVVMPAFSQSSFVPEVMTVHQAEQEIVQMHSCWTYRVYHIVHKAACMLLVARFVFLMFTLNLKLDTDMVFAHQGAAMETTEAHDSNGFYTTPQLLFTNIVLNLCYCKSTAFVLSCLHSAARSQHQTNSYIQL